MKKPIRVLDLIQTLAIVCGIGFGVVEVSNFRADRAQQANLELAQYFRDPAYLEGQRLAYNIPDGASPEEIVEHFGGDEALLIQTGTVFETVGVLVWRGELDLRLVDDLAGGSAMEYWEKTRPYWEDWRARTNRPSVAEWVQWLAERLSELKTTQQAPAYEAFREWRPPA